MLKATVSIEHTQILICIVTILKLSDKCSGINSATVSFCKNLKLHKMKIIK